MTDRLPGIDLARVRSNDTWTGADASADGRLDAVELQTLEPAQIAALLKATAAFDPTDMRKTPLADAAGVLAELPPAMRGEVLDRIELDFVLTAKLADAMFASRGRDAPRLLVEAATKSPRFDGFAPSWVSGLEGNARRSFDREFAKQVPRNLLLAPRPLGEVLGTLVDANENLLVGLDPASDADADALIVQLPTLARAGVKRVLLVNETSEHRTFRESVFDADLARIGVAAQRTNGLLVRQLPASHGEAGARQIAEAVQAKLGENAVRTLVVGADENVARKTTLRQPREGPGTPSAAALLTQAGVPHATVLLEVDRGVPGRERATDAVRSDHRLAGPEGLPTSQLPGMNRHARFVRLEPLAPPRLLHETYERLFDAVGIIPTPAGGRPR